MNALPFVTIPSDTQPKPLVVVLPCAGTRLSRADQARMAELPVNGRLQDVDLQLERLAAKAPALGAELFVSTVHRYVCDVSRAPEELDARLCPALGKGAHPHGVIWRTTTFGTSVHDGVMALDEVESRLKRIHGAFHSHLAALLAAMVERFGSARLLDLRTMSSVGRRAEADAGRPRADVSLGAGRADTLGSLHSFFSGHRFKVARAEGRPGYLAQRHASAAVEVVEVVLNRRLYLHEEVPHWAGAPANELEAIVTDLIASL